MRFPRIAVYNPDLLGRDETVGGFVARQASLRRLVIDLGRKHPNHHLVVGPRGMGKTTLLRRLYFAVHEDSALAARWMPLVFREEQYNVRGLSDLWLNCLDALSDALQERERSAESAALDDTVDHIRELPEPRREREALAALLDWGRRNERRFLLLVDNVDIVLDRLPSDLHWKLREVLSNGQIVVVGACATPPREVYEYGQAFYEHFKQESLRGLDDRETAAMLVALSDLRKTPEVRRIVLEDPGRLKTLRVLTGGNPRAVVLVHQILAKGDLRTVVDDVLALLDLSTPYYKARFESLAAQAQVVLDGVALAWDPIPAGELARRLQLDGNIVSAQLNRLVQDGVVEKVRYPGARAGYQVAERLFNIWYLMRASRRARRKLVWLVQALYQLYGPAFIDARTGEITKDGRTPRDGELLLSMASVLDRPKRYAVEVRALELMAADAQWLPDTALDLRGQDRHLAAPATRIRRLNGIRRKLEHLPALEDGTSVADAVTSLPRSLEERETLAAQLSRSATRDAARGELSEEIRWRAAVPEVLAYYSCVGRGILDGRRLDIDEARRFRELEPQAFEGALQLASSFAWGTDAAARPKLLHALRPDIARSTNPETWFFWLAAADVAEDFATIDRLFQEVPPDQRPSSFWEAVLGGTWAKRAGVWPAQHFLRSVDPSGKRPSDSARWAAAVVAAETSVLFEVPAGRAPPEVLAMSGRWDEAVARAASELDDLPDWSLRSMLRGAVLYHRASDALAWLDATGLGERNRPMREAVASIVSGPDHLLTVAPEIREPAIEIAKWLSFRKEDHATRDADEPGSAASVRAPQPTRRRPSKARSTRSRRARATPRKT